MRAPRATRLALLAFMAGACTDNGGNLADLPRNTTALSAPDSIVVISGDAQTGSGGTALAVPLLVEVRDGAGNPLPAERGTWTIVSGGGSVPRSTFRTNSRGRTSTVWTLGPDGPQRLRVTVGSASFEFHASIAATFADSRLEAVVRATLGIGPDVPIGDSIAQRLTSLDASRKGIASLDGLQYFTAVRRLIATDNVITDLAPIANLTGLIHLDVKSNRITSLVPLAALSALDTLTVAINPLASLAGLENKPNMGALYFGGANRCTISDISLLADMPLLHRLLIHNCPVTSIEALRGLANLRVLHIQSGPLSDLSPIAGKPLRHLGIPWMPSIEDISVVSTLTQLEEFHAWESDITDLTPLTGLTLLREVHVSDNRITSLEPLRGLRLLKFVMADGNQITDVSPLLANTGIGRGDMLMLERNYLVSSFTVFPPDAPTYTVQSCGSDTADTANLDALRARVANLVSTPQHGVECRDTNGDGTPDTPVLQAP